MNSEQIKAAREALDNMDDYARMNTGVDAIGPRKVLEDFITEAERTNQSSQPVLDLGAQDEQVRSWHKVWEVLSEVMPGFHNLSGIGQECAVMAIRKLAASAQDQVAAVRAVPEGMPVTQEPKYGIRENRLFNRASGEFIPLDEPVFIFRARDKLAAQALTDYRFHCADEQHRAAIALRFIDFERFANDHPDRMKYPDTADAPSPQPELSGSIDTPEFKRLIYSLEHSTGINLHNAERRIIYHIDAWKDAACAEHKAAAEDFRHAALLAARESRKMKERATDAEAKLTAILEGVEALPAWWLSADGNPSEIFFTRTSVKNLLAKRTATPSQSDTSGLPG